MVLPGHENEMHISSQYLFPQSFIESWPLFAEKQRGNESRIDGWTDGRTNIGQTDGRADG